MPTNVDSINVCQRVLTRQSLVLTHRGARPQQGDNCNFSRLGGARTADPSDEKPTRYHCTSLEAFIVSIYMTLFALLTWHLKARTQLAFTASRLVQW